MSDADTGSDAVDGDDHEPEHRLTLGLLRRAGTAEILMSGEYALTPQEAADEAGVSVGTARDRLNAMVGLGLFDEKAVLDDGTPRKRYHRTHDGRLVVDALERAVDPAAGDEEGSG